MSAIPGVDSVVVTWMLPALGPHIRVSPVGHNVSHRYTGPCTGDPTRHILGRSGKDVRSMTLLGLEAFSEYEITVTTVYPMDSISVSITVTTLQSGEY